MALFGALEGNKPYLATLTSEDPDEASSAADRLHDISIKRLFHLHADKTVTVTP